MPVTICSAVSRAILPTRAAAPFAAGRLLPRCRAPSLPPGVFAQRAVGFAWRTRRRVYALRAFRRFSRRQLILPLCCNTAGYAAAPALLPLLCAVLSAPFRGCCFSPRPRRNTRARARSARAARYMPQCRPHGMRYGVQDVAASATRGKMSPRSVALARRRCAAQHVAMRVLLLFCACRAARK